MCPRCTVLHAQAFHMHCMLCLQRIHALNASSGQPLWIFDCLPRMDEISVRENVI